MLTHLDPQDRKNGKATKQSKLQEVCRVGGRAGNPSLLRRGENYPYGNATATGKGPTWNDGQGNFDHIPAPKSDVYHWFISFYRCFSLCGFRWGYLFLLCHALQDLSSPTNLHWHPICRAHWNEVVAGHDALAEKESFDWAWCAIPGDVRRRLGN